MMLSVLLALSLPYQPATDALCFKNADPALADAGIPILGKLGAKQGVCQGMAEVTAAFLENAKFAPDLPSTESEQEANTLIARLLAFHRNHARGLVMINGSKNLKEFCEKNKKQLMRAAILENAEIAAEQILPLLPEFFTVKKGNLRGLADQEQLATALSQLEASLKVGQYPLMLYYKHVVMVTGMKELISDSAREIQVTVYDSNRPDQVITHVFPLEMDGLPKLTNHLVWALR